MTDLFRIPARHEAVDQRLTEWAKWVRVKPALWCVQPMFRGYQSKSRQWETDPHIPVAINTLAAHEIEKVVSFLPEKHRTAIRWAYVFSHIPDARVRAELGCTRVALWALVNDARDMLVNRLKVPVSA